jgi:hypothetical protein
LAAWLLAMRCLAGGWRARLGIAGAGLAYISLPLYRAGRDRLPLREWWRIPIVVAAKDMAQMAGAARGLVDAAQGVAQPPPRARRPGEAGGRHGLLVRLPRSDLPRRETANGASVREAPGT